jgi:hypothetical protein
MIAVAPGAELNVSFVAHPDFCDVSCTDHSPLKISQRFDEDFTVLIERAHSRSFFGSNVFSTTTQSCSATISKMLAELKGFVARRIDIVQFDCL